MQNKQQLFLFNLAEKGISALKLRNNFEQDFPDFSVSTTIEKMTIWEMDLEVTSKSQHQRTFQEKNIRFYTFLLYACQFLVRQNS